ncbi:hypothetical protein LguiA_011520 [Lonicera macranthoides]
METSKIFAYAHNHEGFSLPSHPPKLHNLLNYLIVYHSHVANCSKRVNQIIQN